MRSLPDSLNRVPTWVWLLLILTQVEVAFLARDVMDRTGEGP
jgi:hypothetical protein